MFLTIHDHEGNSPTVRLYASYDDAHDAFLSASLDKYSSAIHVVEASTEFMGTTVLKSRWRADGEETIWSNPLA